MKKLPITNFEKFKKNSWQWSVNREMFWRETKSTHHYQLKNWRIEGIQIKWENNAFELDNYFDYVLEK